MRLPSGLTLAVVAGLLVAPVAAPAVPAAYAVECPGSTPPYPGDDAPKAAIAVWMARGAAARGLPGELPVMGALVESNLVNLKVAGSDSKGYFQMREAIWSGTYPGFADNPELQLDWFLDQAVAARTAPYPDETKWGDWVADVERPPEQYRYRYQLRLGDARALIGTPCTAPDTIPPLTQVTAATRQKALQGHGIEVYVSCPAEQCKADVRARVRLGGRPELAAPLATLAPGQVAKVNIRLKPSVRRLAARALERHTKVRVGITVLTTDGAGNTSVTAQRLRITG
ncbi:MAG TPA: hypothetical protein VFI19_07915 [Nocardioides sp.]|nr:hypothetical protein [Nocardioides sp.]